MKCSECNQRIRVGTTLLHCVLTMSLVFATLCDFIYIVAAHIQLNNVLDCVHGNDWVYTYTFVSGAVHGGLSLCFPLPYTA